MTMRSNPARRDPLLPLIGLSVAAAGFELASGFLYASVALNLEQRGASAELVGHQAAMVGVGLALSPILAPWLIGLFGARRLCVFNYIIVGSTLLMFGLYDAIEFWFLLGLTFGIAASIWYVQSEVWLNELAVEAKRGRVVGSFNTLREAGLAFGPLLIPLLGYAGLLPYATMAMVVIVAALPLYWLHQQIDRPKLPSLSEVLFVGRAVPFLSMAVVITGYFDGTILPLWVIYAIEHGLPNDDAVLTLSLIKFGNIAWQLPLGWIADRTSRHHVLKVCILSTGVGAACLPLVDLSSWLAWLYLLCWGGLSFGIFTVSLVLIGDRLVGPQLVTATAILSAMYGIGMVAGPAITGWVMMRLGSVGLPLSIASACSLLLTISFVKMTSMEYGARTQTPSLKKIGGHGVNDTSRRNGHEV